MLIAQGLYKTYKKYANQVKVLNGLDMEVRSGEFLSIVGASGSGKSTLMHLLGTLDQPDEGAVLLDGYRIDCLPPRDRDHLRNQTFGFIFQFYHLLPELTALENTLMPAMIGHSMLGWWRAKKEIRKRATDLLERFGLGHRLKHKPRELSGGEMQRTAIARALICNPRILLADEPTGNLDQETGQEIVKILRDLNKRDGLTIVMVTHNMDLAAGCDRVVRLVGGRVERPTYSPPLAAG
jgi:lipoprotein-releasing system ATP-binding protein